MEKFVSEWKAPSKSIVEINLKNSVKRTTNTEKLQVIDRLVQTVSQMMASVSGPWGTGSSPSPADCCNAELDVCVAQTLAFNINTKHSWTLNVPGNLDGGV